MRDSIAEAFHLEATLPSTAIRLLFKPGALTNDWLEGRRVRYLSPIAVYTIAAVAFFLASSWIAGGMYIPEYSEAQLPLDRALRIFLPVVSVPIVAVTSRLSFRSLQASLTPNVVFSLHVHGFLLFVAALLLVPLRTAHRNPDHVLLFLAGAVFVLLGLLYVAAATRRVWCVSWRRAVVGTLLMLIQYVILAIVVIGIAFVTTYALLDAFA